MKLTPLEIRKQEFSKSMRGYNTEEVRAYLETVADQFDQVQKKNSEFSEKVVQLEARLSDFQSIEKSLQETLMKAEESSRKARDDSVRESDIILREAEVKAQRLLMDAHQDLERLKSEILLLKARRDAIIKKFKYLLLSQSELIDVFENNDFTSIERTNQESGDDHP